LQQRVSSENHRDHKTTKDLLIIQH